MRKICFLIIVSFTIGFCYSQVSADSLKGTYVGQYYYANPATNPWTITQDTEYVFSVDTINCKFYATGCMDFSFGGFPVYTDYYSCNGTPPSNFYIKFYSGDSLRIVGDNQPQPWPNPPFSNRFFGKRISAYVPFGIKKYEDQEIKIYPNPVSAVFTLQSGNELGYIFISNLIGEIFYEKKTNNLQEQVDVSSLPNGIYFLQLQTPEGTLTKKIIVQR